MKTRYFHALSRRFAMLNLVAAMGILLTLAPTGTASAQPADPQAPAPQIEPVETDAPAQAEPVETDAPAPPAPALDPAPTQPEVTPQTEAEAFATPDIVGQPAGDLPMVETGMGHDMSPIGMFMMADIVVKAVMIGLALAAVITWIIWLGKWLQLLGARGRARRTLRAVSNAASLKSAVDRLDGRKGVGVLLVRAANEELQTSADLMDAGAGAGAGIKERVISRLSRIEAAAGRKMTQGTGILASIGSVAPFVGLFGTVWGIMNSFISIAETQTTNLAVVAPGIAEALLATAIGLVAAIPAVIIYNSFARSISGYRQLLADVSAAIERLVSRDLDRSALLAAPAPQTQAAE